MRKRLLKFKWLYVVLLVLLVWMTYANMTGWRLFTFGSDSNSWSAGGPGYHK